MSVVGTDVIVDERKIDNVGDFPEKVVLRNEFFNRYVVKQLGLGCATTHQSVSLHLLLFMEQYSTKTVKILRFH